MFVFKHFLNAVHIDFLDIFLVKFSGTPKSRRTIDLALFKLMSGKHGSIYYYIYKNLPV